MKIFMIQQRSIIFRYIVKGTYTEEDLNKIALQYESDVDSRVVAREQRLQVNRNRTKKRQQQLDKQKLFNCVMEYIDNLLLDTKDKLNDELRNINIANSTEANNKIEVK